MKKGIVFTFALLFSLSLLSCSKATETNREETIKIVEVNLVMPEEVFVNEQVVITAKVTENGEPVVDANEVLFEVWVEESKQNSKMYEPTSQSGGDYQLELLFDEPGNYYVQSHVTARSMHVMPKKKIVVK